MRRVFPVAGWLLAIACFGVLVAFNVGIAGELLRLPLGFDPGWWPLIDFNVIYGGGGVLVVLLVRMARQRWLLRGTVIP